jgi:hypothetical protein
LFEEAALEGAGLVAGGADAGRVAQDVEVAGLSGDASASGAVVVPSLRLYCQIPGTGPSRAVRVMCTVPADRVA